MQESTNYAKDLIYKIFMYLIIQDLAIIFHFFYVFSESVRTVRRLEVLTC